MTSFNRPLTGPPEPDPVTEAKMVGYKEGMREGFELGVASEQRAQDQREWRMEQWYEDDMRRATMAAWN